MTYSLLVFLSRKPGTTPEEFRNYYANSHLHLFRRLVGPEHFPKLHTQRYIHRTAATGDDKNNTPRNPTTPAVVFAGSQADFDYDVVVTLEYKDEAAWKAACEVFAKPEIADVIAADEEKFLDRSQTRVVALGEIIEMTPQ